LRGIATEKHRRSKDNCYRLPSEVYPSSVGMGAFFRTFVPAAKAAIGSL